MTRHRKARGRGGRRRGIALIMAVLVLSLLMALVIQFTYSTQIAIHASRNAKSSLTGRYMARGAVNAVMAYFKHEAAVHPEKRYTLGGTSFATEVANYAKDCDFKFDRVDWRLRPAFIRWSGMPQEQYEVPRPLSNLARNTGALTTDELLKIDDALLLEVSRQITDPAEPNPKTVALECWVHDASSRFNLNLFGGPNNPPATPTRLDTATEVLAGIIFKVCEVEQIALPGWTEANKLAQKLAEEAGYQKGSPGTAVTPPPPLAAGTRLYSPLQLVPAFELFIKRPYYASQLTAQQVQPQGIPPDPLEVLLNTLDRHYLACSSEPTMNLNTVHPVVLFGAIDGWRRSWRPTPPPSPDPQVEKAVREWMVKRESAAAKDNDLTAAGWGNFMKDLPELEKALRWYAGSPGDVNPPDGAADPPPPAAGAAAPPPEYPLLEFFGVTSDFFDLYIKVAVRDGTQGDPGVKDDFAAVVRRVRITSPAGSSWEPDIISWKPLQSWRPLQ